MPSEDDLWYGFPGEERLLGNIISQALKDLRSPRYRAEAWRYFNSQDIISDTSFLSICKLLNINEDNILCLVKKRYLFDPPATNVARKFPEVFEN
jgi:hypothetical protein